jgi:aryl-alcohol dehydrogenase-like predicted oxidoreductase
MGCWAIGGPAWRDGNPIGWGEVDDAESIRAVHRALDLGVNLFDTANIYGAGHSEVVLGQALKGRREQAVIATKFTSTFDEATKQAGPPDVTADGIRRACDDSLRRLQTDVIDLLQFHAGGHPVEESGEVRDTLEGLVEAGKIRTYGWSTDSPERAEFFAKGPHCSAVQVHFNVFGGNDETLAVAERENLGALIRGPLGMGILTGKFNKASSVPDDDVRSRWNFSDGPIADQLEKLDNIRSILTEGGRTLAQGALGWLWARSPKTLPIPGFKNTGQVEENAAAMQFGPLSQDQMDRIEKLLA